jgi:hypothetical protein
MHASCLDAPICRSLLLKERPLLFHDAGLAPELLPMPRLTSSSSSSSDFVIPLDPSSDSFSDCKALSSQGE